MKDVIWLTTDSESDIKRLLTNVAVINDDAKILAVEPAGEGNMNVTLRVMLESEQPSLASVIVKQSRPYVAKYDFIPAPIDRIEHEAAFYQFAQGNKAIESLLPNLLAWIPEQYVLVVQDLGEAADASCWYRELPPPEQLTRSVETLLDWLLCLHHRSTASFDSESSADRYRNMALRELNHQHIFELPFKENPPLDLDAVCPGLTEVSASMRASSTLRKTCLELGQRYLGSGPCLLHGDFYPGSWLVLPDGPRVIDPEFCFAGPAEFDLGVMAAHLELCGWQDSSDRLRTMTEHATYAPNELNWELVQDFAAVEILRRILGVAQLPLSDGLDFREQQITKATGRLLQRKTSAT